MNDIGSVIAELLLLSQAYTDRLEHRKCIDCSAIYDEGETHNTSCKYSEVEDAAIKRGQL